MLQGDLLFKELSDLLLGAGEDAPERADYMASRDMHAWDSEALQADIQMLKKAVQTRDGVTSGQAEEARRSRRRSRDDSDWDSDEIGGDSDSFNKRRQGHPSSGDGLNVGCAGITARMSWNTSGRDRVRHGGSPGLASSQDVPPTPLAAAALGEAVEHEWSTPEEEEDACLVNSSRPGVLAADDGYGMRYGVRGHIGPCASQTVGSNQGSDECNLREVLLRELLCASATPASSMYTTRLPTCDCPRVDLFGQATG